MKFLKKLRFQELTVIGLCFLTFCSSGAQIEELRRTGWNIYATRFMYAPKFQVEATSQADHYRLVVTNGQETVYVESPGTSLSLQQVWAEMPSGTSYNAQIFGLDANKNLIAECAPFSFHKVTSFDGGYRNPARSYRESGLLAADSVAASLLEWSDSAEADMDALLESLLTLENSDKPVPYPALLLGRRIDLLLNYHQMNRKSEKGQKALYMAQVLAEHLIETRTPLDWIYGGMPRTHLNKPRKPLFLKFNRPEDHFERYKAVALQVPRSAGCGQVMIRMYQATDDKKYLEAARIIAKTLVVTQMQDGNWPFRVLPETGAVVEEYTSDQITALNFLDGLVTGFGEEEFASARDKALCWMFENPVKTMLWQNQYEDVLALEPYENLEFSDLARLIEYLTRYKHGNPDYTEISSNLYRFVEDQFVLWENSMDQTWITPGVKEQYVCYHPISAHSAAFIHLSINLHRLTGEEIYLAKARAIADTLTAIQHPDGYYPTHMFQTPAPPGELGQIDYSKIWPNCTASAAMALLALDEYLNEAKARPN